MRVTKEMIKDFLISALATSVVSIVAYMIWDPLAIFTGTIGLIATVGVLSAHSIGLNPRDLYQAYRLYTKLGYADGDRIGVMNMMDMAFSPEDVMEDVKEKQREGDK
jgi:hypothetical protein